MSIEIYLSNLARFIEGRENGRWIQLPMDSDKLQLIFNEIAGENQEWIILDYNAPFDILEYKNIFVLNAMLENLSTYIFDDDILTALFKCNSSCDEVLEAIENGTYVIINVDEVSSGWSTSLNREEIFGMVLEDQGYNNLFSQSIPEEMYDYMDFSQIYTCLSINDGWQHVDVENTTYLIRM